MNTEHNKKIKIWLTGLLFANLVVFCAIIFRGDLTNAFYFFDVGQGDSEMVIVDGAKVLIDTGKGNKIVNNLERIMPSSLDRHIDIVAISHPELDHADGLLSIVGKYKIGVVLYNGEENILWGKIKDRLDKFNVPYIAVKRGDSIIIGDSKFDVLWPNKFIKEPKSNNDRSMVLRFCNNFECALYTGDITGKVENILANLGEIKADILKVAHHGSKFSSENSFINVVNPKIAVIEVGKNSYGHPTKEAIDRISSVGANILRTDMDGIIKIIPEANILKIFKLNK